MEHVVYVLGAGFSAPLGLPVVANFLIKSKDLYFEDRAKFAHFTKVFDTLATLPQAKHYFNVDLFNVEEILSLLEMEDYTAGTRHHRDFVLYMRDVIAAYTPSLSTRLTSASNWYEFVFGPDRTWQEYCTFVASLFELKIIGKTGGPEIQVSFEREARNRVRYSIVSLNYDLVLEMCLREINKVTGSELSFATEPEECGPSTVALAKIHGSIDPLTIVPPTWNKTARREVRKAWRVAHAVLSDATQIRVLGYSLPQTDAYFRYLLELSAIRAPHLKSFDVLCLDQSGDVHRRYREFVTFYRARFKNFSLQDYTAEVLSHARSRVGQLPDRSGAFLTYDKLERSHESIFSRPDA